MSSKNNLKNIDNKTKLEIDIHNEIGEENDD